jgi:hypothetical protein
MPITKTPDEILDYEINWATRGLGTDTIATSVWSVFPAGLEIAAPAPTFTSTSATVWLSGGIADTNYLVTNTITTDGGREFQDSFILNCIAYRVVTS